MQSVLRFGSLLTVFTAPTGSVVASAAPTALSVTVVGSDKSDPRWRALEEAVEFWNLQPSLVERQFQRLSARDKAVFAAG
jgi:hypothetical protein